MDLQEAVEGKPAPAAEKHLSVRALVGSVFVLIVLALILFLIVEARRPVDVDGSQGTWGGTGGVEFWSGVRRNQEAARQSVEELLAQQRRDDVIRVDTSLPYEYSDEPLDLTHVLQNITAPATGETGFSAYDFLPNGLISGEPPKTQTQLQRDLYRYGNDLGGYLRTFEDSHFNMLTTLKNAREDLGNVEKANAAAQIGIDYRYLGRDLQEMQGIPGPAQTLHAAFAAAHTDVGKKLEAVARAQNDEEFLAAVDVYNKSVEGYAEKFVAIASLFAASEVTFSDSDPGSVFSFRGSVSLY